MNKLRAILIEIDPTRGSTVEQLLNVADCEVVARYSDMAELLAQSARPAAEFVAIAADVLDSAILNDMVAIQSAAPSPLVMFAPDQQAHTIQRAVQVGVSAYVVDGVNPARMRSILEAAIARFRQFKALAEELHKTRCQLTERKVIERAKGIVMSQRGLAEDEAYKLMRKTAMDRNKRMVEIADSIIAASDLLGSGQGSTPQAIPVGAA